jgi:hypothetical protein
MKDAAPSLVRVRAIAEYASLRATIAELRALTSRLGPPGQATVDEVFAVAARLLRELSDYVDLEELFVLPTVRASDVWGELRATALGTRHQAQRDELRAIAQHHHWPADPSLLAHDLEAFAQALSDSLAREKREVLDSDVFRDDVVQTKPD